MVWKRQYESLPMITLFAVENSAISGYNRKSDFYQKSYFDAMESLQKSLLLHPLYFFLFVTYISSMALIRYHRVILFLVEVC